MITTEELKRLKKKLENDYIETLNSIDSFSKDIAYVDGQKDIVSFLISLSEEKDKNSTMNTLIDVDETKSRGEEFVYCQFEDMNEEELQRAIAKTLADMNLDTVDFSNIADIDYILDYGVEEFMKAKGFELIKNDIVRPSSNY